MAGEEKRTDRQRFPVGTLRRNALGGGENEEVSRTIRTLEERVSQVDAVGQNPDAKGKTILNLGGLGAVDAIGDPSTATAEDCANKINEILGALK